MKAKIVHFLLLLVTGISGISTTAWAGAPSCADVLTSAYDTRFLTATERNFIKELEAFDKTPHGSVARSGIQARELNIIAKKSAAKIAESSERLPSELKLFLKKFSLELDQQLRDADVQKKVTPEFSLDWAHRYNTLLSMIDVQPQAIQGFYGYPAEVLLQQFTAVRGDYKTFSKNMSLENFGIHIKQRSYSAYIRENLELKKNEPLDIFVTEKEVGLDFFNQILDLPTQIFGYVYEPIAFDGGTITAPINFLEHDFVHFNREKSRWMADPEFRKVVSRFVKLYNKKLLSLNRTDAEDLIGSMFLAEHEATKLVSILHFLYMKKETLQDLSRGLRGVSLAVEIPGVPQFLSSEHQAVIMEIIAEAVP